MPAIPDHSTVIATVESPATPDGAALSVIALSAEAAEELDAALEALSLAPLPAGSMRLLDLLGVDEGLAVRWSPTLVHLTPHGGALISRRLFEAIGRRGIQTRTANDSPRLAFPEAADHIEACALDALASAASPRAVDVLLHQRDLWRKRLTGSTGRAAPAAVQASLDRLLRPPTVVLIGAPNIGKSTLTNALAGRLISIVADEPGVTRDHVGVSLDLDGLAIRLIDAPGIATQAGAEPADPSGRGLALAIARRADLLILCADPTAPFSDPLALGFSPEVPVLHLGLRADLGAVPGAEVEVSVRSHRGLEAAAAAIRRRLLPDAALTTTDLWRFHPALPSGPAPG